jgi:hypothetical protein
MTASPVIVEKLLKKFKAYKFAMDFDSTFCKAVYYDDKGESGSGASASS